jgi:acyl dehydratase
MYFEDFSVGDVYVHSRGRTITHYDNYAMTHFSLNTAEAHFNLEYSKQLLDGSLTERIVVGLCNIGVVVGLTSQDMSENALADVGMTGIKLTSPVFAGDTLHAKSEVLELSQAADRDDVGRMRYRFTATNQRGLAVAEGERTVLLKKRRFWGDRDDIQHRWEEGK